MAGILEIINDPVALARCAERERLQAEREAAAQAAQEDLGFALAIVLREALEEESKEFIKIKAETYQSYAYDLRKFEQWCAEVGLSPLPATPETLATFLLHVGNENPPMRRLLRIVAAIGTAHRLKKFKNPTDDLVVKAALRDIRGRTKPKTAKPKPEGSVH